MDRMKIEKQLIDHEGIRQFPYKCTAGKLTIGVGRNIEDVGISSDEIMLMLHNDIEDCTKDLIEIFGWEAWHDMTDARQHALIDMRFNLGPRRFRGFKNMIAAISNYNDWDRASEEALDSKWAREDVSMDRSALIAHQLRTGRDK